MLETNIADEVILEKGIFAKTFNIMDKQIILKKSNLRKCRDLVDFSDNYNFKFENSGYMFNGIVYTAKRARLFKHTL